jgi:tetratricopeptide (TPR) repeat protein
MTEAQANASPNPSATGVLARTPLAHLYVYLSERRLTGTLVLRPADGPEASLYIRDGHALRIHTTEQAHYLGRVLTDLGYINEHQLRISLDRLKAEKKQHGQILIESAFISASQLADGLRQQANRKLRAIFRYAPATTYAYYADVDHVGAASTDSPIAIDLLPVTWRAINEYPSWDTVHATLQRVASGKVQLARNADLPRCEFLHDEAAAALALKSARSVDELADLGLLDPRTCQLLVYFLLITKQVEVLGAVMTDEDPTSQRFARHSSIPSGPTSSSETLAPPSGSRPSTPASGVSSGTMPIATPSSSTVTGTPAERRVEVERVASSLDGLDWFELLGVERTVTSAEASKAFMALAKRWHPDRLPAELADLKGVCATIFARLNEAHAVLSNDEKRAAYLAAGPRASSTSVDAAVASSLTAAAAFQKAEFFLSRGDVGEAERFAQQALELDRNAPEIQSIVAWIEGSRNGAPTRVVEDAVVRLTRALETSDSLEKAFFWRGMLLKKLGRSAEAVSDFKRAVDLNPHNIDAAREVRLFNMRQSKDDPLAGAVPSSSASTSLLRRLLKK